MEPRRILLVVSGGIAAYKAPELVRELQRAGNDVRCVMTRAAAAFVSPLVIQALTREPVRMELLDPGEEGRIGHIDLADWAELVLVAPATANLLAKLAAGLADDLASTVLLATRAPLLVAPAMNVNMWQHPATRSNVARLEERGVTFVGPESGFLACGWEGEGRLAALEAISAAVRSAFGPRDLEGERVLVTAGGTREPIDAVRVIANRSSGKMGYALAAEAARRGAEVVLVSGPTSLPAPAGVRRIGVETALEMRDAALAELQGASVVLMAAAVGDFRPGSAAKRKIKKEDLAPGEPLRLELVANPDILAEIALAPGERLVVGFAAESHDVLASARRKLARKGCTLLVANDISRSDAGFDSDRNAVWILGPGDDVEELPLLPKREIAARILERVAKLREARR